MRISETKTSYRYQGTNNEHRTEEYTAQYRAGFKCLKCKSYVVKDVVFDVKAEYWFAIGRHQRRIDKTVKSEGVFKNSSYGTFIKCSCGEVACAKFFEMRESEHKCNSKCLASKGHQCECSCGGANHGKNYQA